ncbi:MAG: hypothetical protein K0R05_48 [Anaerocolumna sp.]|jgi:signal transduction histidine kinase|nr:hypothetical protein [Anaerocolumna sp.]
MNEVIFIVGLFLSSFVSVHIIMDFMGTLFEKNRERWVYFLIEALFVLLLAGVNAVSNAWLNLITVFGITVILAVRMYKGKVMHTLLFTVILIIGMSACESIGILILHSIYNMSDIVIESARLKKFYDMTISQLIVIFISHMVLLRYAKKKDISHLSGRQYLFTFVYAFFSVLNIYSLSILMKDIKSQSAFICVMITCVGIVVINIYFLNILEYESENNRLIYENKLFGQQSKMQYQYYDALELQYRESLSIIHDVKRHIRSIEELYTHQETGAAREYAITINNRLDAFRLNEYTTNRMLNIILNDKIKLAENNKIEFQCKIDEIDLSFIDNMDLTTIFANLLDNAIEACARLNSGRIINLKVGSFNNLVAITIKNPMIENPDNNSHISIIEHYRRAEHAGIGIPNVVKVVEKYKGDFNIQKEEGMYSCSIVLSKKGKRV